MRKGENRLRNNRLPTSPEPAQLGSQQPRRVPSEPRFPRRSRRSTGLPPGQRLAAASRSPVPAVPPPPHPAGRPYLHGAAQEGARVGRQLLHVEVHDVHLAAAAAGAESAPRRRRSRPGPALWGAAGGRARARRRRRLGAAVASGAGPGSAAQGTTASAAPGRGGAGRDRAGGASRLWGRP